MHPRSGPHLGHLENKHLIEIWALTQELILLNIDLVAIASEHGNAIHGHLHTRGYRIGGLSPLYKMHKMHNFNGFFDPQYGLQLIAEAKHGFIVALHQQDCPLSITPERFSHWGAREMHDFDRIFLEYNAIHACFKIQGKAHLHVESKGLLGKKILRKCLF